MFIHDRKILISLFLSFYACVDRFTFCHSVYCVFNSVLHRNNISIFLGGTVGGFGLVLVGHPFDTLVSAKSRLLWGLESCTD